MSDLEKKLNEYRNQFGEIFPLMEYMGIPENELIQIIQACMESGTPCNPEEDETIDC